MALLESLEFGWDSVAAVKSRIANWNPSSCHSEKDYERSLAEFLRSHLHDIPVITQFAFGRHKADLVINGNVIVEVKADLKTTAEYQRLIGQLDQYQQWEGAVVVLLVGRWDEQLRIELKRWIDKRWDGKFHLMTKSARQTTSATKV